MKTTFIKALALLALYFNICYICHSPVHAGEPVKAEAVVEEEDSGYGITLSTAVYSSYVYDGLKYGGASLQSEIAWESESGWFASIWHNYSFDNSGAREIDIIVGKSFEWGDTSLEVGTGWYNFAGLSGTEGDLWSVYGKLAHAIPVESETFSISAFVQLDGYIPMSGDAEGGLVCRVGLESEWKLTDKLVLELLLEAVHDGGVYESNPGWFAKAHAGVSYSVTDSVSIIAGCDIYVALSDFGGEDRDHVVGFLGVSYSF